MAIIKGMVKIIGQAKFNILAGWRTTINYQTIDTTWDEWY